MLSESNILLYLDDLLVKNMASLFLDGYIEVQTFKRVFDLSLAGKVRYAERSLNFFEDRTNKTHREGFKEKIYTDVYNYTTGKERENCFENRGAQRIEEETKRIYTSFMLHNQLVSNLQNRNIIKTMNPTLPSNLNCGEYISCTGCILPESNLVYIENIISIIKAIGFNQLNTLLPCGSILTFESVLNIFTDIFEKLSNQNTLDMIAKCNNTDIVLTVNETCFLNQQTHRFDQLNCDCKFVGKVMKNCQNGNEAIHLLRKTGNQEFYENMINICLPILKNLSKIGIKLPEPPRFSLDKNPMQIKPISIYI